MQATHLPVVQSDSISSLLTQCETLFYEKKWRECRDLSIRIMKKLMQSSSDTYDAKQVDELIGYIETFEKQTIKCKEGHNDYTDSRQKIKSGEYKQSLEHMNCAVKQMRNPIDAAAYVDRALARGYAEAKSQEFENDIIVGTFIARFKQYDPKKEPHLYWQWLWIKSHYYLAIGDTKESEKNLAELKEISLNSEINTAIEKKAARERKTNQSIQGSLEFIHETSLKLSFMPAWLGACKLIFEQDFSKMSKGNFKLLIAAAENFYQKEVIFYRYFGFSSSHYEKHCAQKSTIEDILGFKNKSQTLEAAESLFEKLNKIEQNARNLIDTKNWRESKKYVTQILMNTTKLKATNPREFHITRAYVYCIHAVNQLNDEKLENAPEKALKSLDQAIEEYKQYKAISEHSQTHFENNFITELVNIFFEIEKKVKIKPELKEKIGALSGEMIDKEFKHGKTYFENAIRFYAKQKNKTILEVKSSTHAEIRSDIRGITAAAFRLHLSARYHWENNNLAALGYHFLAQEASEYVVKDSFYTIINAGFGSHDYPIVISELTKIINHPALKQDSEYYQIRGIFHHGMQNYALMQADILAGMRIENATLKRNNITSGYSLLSKLKEYEKIRCPIANVQEFKGASIYHSEDEEIQGEVTVDMFKQVMNEIENENYSDGISILSHLIQISHANPIYYLYRAALYCKLDPDSQDAKDDLAMAIWLKVKNYTDGYGKEVCDAVDSWAKCLIALSCDNLKESREHLKKFLEYIEIKKRSVLFKDYIIDIAGLSKYPHMIWQLPLTETFGMLSVQHLSTFKSNIISTYARAKDFFTQFRLSDSILKSENIKVEKTEKPVLTKAIIAKKDKIKPTTSRAEMKEEVKPAPKKSKKKAVETPAVITEEELARIDAEIETQFKENARKSEQYREKRRAKKEAELKEKLDESQAKNAFRLEKEKAKRPVRLKRNDILLTNSFVEEEEKKEDIQLLEQKRQEALLSIAKKERELIEKTVQARQKAKTYSDIPPIATIPLREFESKILDALEKNIPDANAFIIGGTVLSRLIQLKKVSLDKIEFNPKKDVDMFVDGTPEQILLALKEYGVKQNPNTDKLFHIDVKDPQNSHNVIRIDIWRSDKDHTLLQELRARDFTLNTFIANKKGHVFDLLGSSTDLENGCIQTTIPADQSFSNDPYRIIRANKLKAEYPEMKFQFHAEVKSAIVKHAHEIPNMADSFRLHAFFKKMLCDAQQTDFKKNLEFIKNNIHLLFDEILASRILEEWSWIEFQLKKPENRSLGKIYMTFLVAYNTQNKMNQFEIQEIFDHNKHLKDRLDNKFFDHNYSSFFREYYNFKLARHEMKQPLSGFGLFGSREDPRISFSPMSFRMHR